MQHPIAVTACNLDLENMITDSNRSIATLAITTLLKVLDFAEKKLTFSAQGLPLLTLNFCQSFFFFFFLLYSNIDQLYELFPGWGVCNFFPFLPKLHFPFPFLLSFPFDVALEIVA